MTLLTWGITLGMLGKVLLAVTVLGVHAHIYKERKIDADVLRALRRDRNAAIIGVSLIVIGYLMEMYAYAGTASVL